MEKIPLDFILLLSLWFSHFFSIHSMLHVVLSCGNSPFATANKCLATAFMRAQHHRWFQRCIPLISPTPPIHQPTCMGQGMGTCTSLQNLPRLGNTSSAVPVPCWCHAKGASVPPAPIAGVVAVFGGIDLSPTQMVLPVNHACSVLETCFLIFFTALIFLCDCWIENQVDFYHL